MKRAQSLLVSILFAASAIGATAPAVTAYTGSAWSNSDAFSAGCLGFTDSYPQLMYNQAAAQLPRLGYNYLGGRIGAGFTRSAFLTQVYYDYATYVHSHGDNYWAASGYPNVDSGFLADPGSGRCSGSSEIVRSSSVKVATQGTPYNLVIMSTCYLGSNSSTMPGAFQIAKSKSSGRREFFLGYTYSTYDSSQYRFENAFFAYLTASTSRTALQAFTYALSIGGYAYPDSSDPFVPNWWGNPYYNGRAG